jgi:hypothetical protein
MIAMACLLFGFIVTFLLLDHSKTGDYSKPFDDTILRPTDIGFMRVYVYTVLQKKKNLPIVNACRYQNIPQGLICLVLEFWFLVLIFVSFF